MTTFQAKSQLPSEMAVPDEYDPSKGRIPPDDFVVSRNKDGSALSYYGEFRWDRTPYSSDGRAANLIFIFWNEGELTPQRNHIARELRWLMFVLLFLRSGQCLSNGTLRHYATTLQYVARFCESRSIRIQDLLADPLLIIESLGRRWNLAHYLSSLIVLLNVLGPDVIGFDVARKKEAVQMLQKLHRAWSVNNKQHSPIPTRIYSSIISALSQELDDFERAAESILQLFEECASDPLMGRSLESQCTIRSRRDLEFKKVFPNFTDLLRKYGLDEYWSTKGYKKSVHGLSTALTEVMVVASLQIQAFTGMRSNEVESLPHHCLDEVKRVEDGRIHYFVKGFVTKHAHGKIKRVQWVTSESGRAAIRIAQRISQMIYNLSGETPKISVKRINSHYLFISPRHVTHRGKNTPAFLNLSIFKALRVRLQPVINEEDMVELEQIDPHRAWRSEEAFQIGKPWTLTSHQLRRSLALYAQRSGLVSLPSLKRQLQHITQEMSTYYGRGSAFARNFIGDDDKMHFGFEWQDTQPVSQFLSYAAHVLLTNETLFGVHPHWITHRLRNSDGVVVFDRAVTLKRFQKGEIAYRETILGGCVKVGECDRNPLDLLEVECLSTHCKNLVGHKKKLERVIAAQSHQVVKLKQIDPKSPEYRHERDNLEVLKKTLENVSKNAGVS